MGNDIKIHSIYKEVIYNLKENPNNPNKCTKEQLESISNSIKKFGFLDPIIINKDNIVINGNHRLKVAHKLGLDEVPVIKLDITETEGILLTNILNKLHGTSDWDLDLIEYKKLLDEQGNLNQLKEFVAMEEEEIDNILEGLGVKEKEEEKEREEESRPQNKAILKFRTREELESAIDHLEAIKVKFNAKLDIRI
jgi:ParB-like chromosome segregation protein Spo0J